MIEDLRLMIDRGLQGGWPAPTGKQFYPSLEFRSSGGASRHATTRNGIRPGEEVKCQTLTNDSRRSSSIPLLFRVQAAAASLKRALKTLHLVGTPCVASLSQGEATSLSLGLGVTPLQRSILRALGKSRYALLNGRGAARPYRAFRISLLPNKGALASFVLAPWRGNCFEPAYLYFVGWKT